MGPHSKRVFACGKRFLVQWVRLCTSDAGGGGHGSDLIRKLRPHVSCNLQSEKTRNVTLEYLSLSFLGNTFNYLFLIGGLFLYTVELVSAVQRVPQLSVYIYLLLLPLPRPRT